MLEIQRRIKTSHGPSYKPRTLVVTDKSEEIAKMSDWFECNCYMHVTSKNLKYSEKYWAESVCSLAIEETCREIFVDIEDVDISHSFIDCVRKYLRSQPVQGKYAKTFKLSVKNQSVILKIVPHGRCQKSEKLWKETSMHFSDWSVQKELWLRKMPAV